MPSLRNLPLVGAKLVSYIVVASSYFAALYVLGMYLLLPLYFMGVSLWIEAGGWRLVAGVAIIVLTLITILALIHFWHSRGLRERGKAYIIMKRAEATESLLKRQGSIIGRNRFGSNQLPGPAEWNGSLNEDD